MKRLLQRAVMESPNVSAPITPIELSLWVLEQIEVRREWQHIDIFLLDERDKLAAIIENKIGTSEHDDQLNRYHATVREKHPEYKLLAIYLTPDGDEPSHPKYLPIDYRAVCEILDELAESRASVTEPDLQVLITHYIEMLRRYIVGDSEIGKLSRQIYEKHSQAIKIILEHQPDRQDVTRQLLEELVTDESKFIHDEHTRNRVRFILEDWDSPVLLEAEAWTKSKRILLFEFWNDQSSLQLKLMVGPGSDEIRQYLFAMASANAGVLRTPRNLEVKHGAIFSGRILEPVNVRECYRRRTRSGNPRALDRLPRKRLATDRRCSQTGILDLGIGRN